MNFVRVYSGALRKGDMVMTSRKGHTLRVGRLETSLAVEWLTGHAPMAAALNY